MTFPALTLRNKGRVLSSIGLLLLPGLLLVLNIFLFSPGTVYSGNNSEFGFDLLRLASVFLYPALFFLSFLAVLALFLPSKVVRYISSIILTIAILLWIQASFIVRDYGLLDGKGIRWESYTWQGYFDSIIWIIGLSFAIAIAKLITRRAVLLSIILLLTQGAWLSSQAIMSSDKFISALPTQHEAPKSLFGYSSKFNIIHFILDGFQTEVFRDIVRENALEKSFDGFTLYPENVTASGSTFLSVASIFSGELYTPDTDKVSFFKTSIQQKSFHNELLDNGYTVNLVPGIKLPTERFSTYYSVPRGYGGSKEEKLLSEAALLLDLSLFRSLPHPFKRLVYNDQNWFLQKYFNIKKRIGYYNHFDFLRDYASSIFVGDRRPAYHYLHIVLPHPPFVTDSLGNCAERVLEPTKENYKIQAKTVLLEVINFLNKLKQIGLYDSSVIILQADHGIEFPVIMLDEPSKGKVGLNSPSPSLVGRATALLTVKMPNSHDQIRISNAQTSTLDIAPTIMDIAGLHRIYEGMALHRISQTTARHRWYTDKHLISGSVYQASSWGGGSYHKTAAGPLASEDDYLPGTVIDFSFLGNAQRYLKEGWGDPEEEHSWTVANYASMEIPLNKSASDLILSAIIRPHAFPGKIPKQDITLFVNDHKLTTWSLDGPAGFSQYRLHIPSKLISSLGGKPLTLGFKIPYATSPLEIQTSSDPRKLGVAFKSLTLSEIQPISGNAGLILKFGKNGNAIAYKEKGWSDPEESGTWTINTSASLIIPIKATKGNLKVKMLFSPFLAPGKITKQLVTLCANDQEVAQWTTTKPGNQELSFTIPSKLFVGADFIDLKLTIPDAASPKALGISSDERLLGLMVKRIEFEFVQQDE